MKFGIIGVVLYTVVIAFNLSFRRETARFLEQNASIADLNNLEAFKNLARRNMKAVFPLCAVVLMGMALSAQLIIYDPLSGFVTFLLLNGLFVWSSLALGKVENAARKLTCQDPVLAAEYQRISKSWLCDPWPKF